MGLTREFEKTLKEKFIGDSDPNNGKSILIERVLIPLCTKISAIQTFEKYCDQNLSGLSATKSEDLEKIFNYLCFNVKIHSNIQVNLDSKYMIVSNHPTGPFDGIFIQKIFNHLGLRGKTVGDNILGGVEQLGDIILGLSIRSDSKSKIAELRAIKKEIKLGINLALFPSGSVSHFNLKKMKVSEYEWYSGFIELAKSNDLDIIPVYIDTNLSPIYYFFKEVYHSFGSLMLFREFIKFVDRNKKGTINLYIGDPISINDIESTKEFASKIQDICENLKYQIYTHIE